MAVASTALFYAGLLTIAVDAAVDRGGVRVGAGAPLSQAGVEPDELDTLGAAGTATTVPGGARTTGTSSTGGAGGSRPGSGGAGGGPGAGEPGSGPASAAPSRGVTDTEIRVGIALPVRSGSASMVGAQGIVDPGEETAQAVVDWINDNGGMAGRTLVPVYDEIDTTSATFAAEANAACVKWTDDEPVFAVAGWGYDREDLLSCLAAKDTPLVKEAMVLYDQELFSRYRGYLYTSSMVAGERLGVWVDQLAGAGFFQGAAGVGIVRWDSPEYARASENVVRPRLAAAGVGVKDEVAVKYFRSASELGDVSAAMQNAVLRFNSQNIDRVLILDSGSPLTMFFAISAESQQYRPRYGLNSFNYADQVARNAPARQFEGSLGVGWRPAGDSAMIDADNPATKQCFDIYTAAGIQPASTGDGQANQLRFCAQLFFIRDALARAPSLTTQGLLAGVEALGDDFDSAMTFATHFGPGRYDGASVARFFHWDTGCGCFQFSSEDIPLP